MTLGLGRDALVRIPTNDALRAAAGRAREPRSPPTEPRAAGRSRSWPPSGRRPRPRWIRSPRSPTSPSAEGLWLHVDCGLCRAPSPCSRRHAEPFDGLGARRLDRRQPAQVAVHAARRLAAPDAPHGRAAGRVQPRARNTCGRSTARRRSATTTSTRRSSAVGSARSSSGSSCAGSGSRGCAGGSAAHLELAAWFAAAVDADPDWERLAPVPFSTVCFRWHPRGWSGTDEALDDANAAIMDAVNRTGEVFLSHTRLAGRFTIRVSIGNLRTEARHVERAWALLREAAASVSGPSRDADPARRPVLRDRRGAARLVRGQSRDGRGAVARLPPEGHRPAERRLATRRRRGAVRRVDRQRPRTDSTRRRSRSGSRRDARAATGARSTSPRSAG